MADAQAGPRHYPIGMCRLFARTREVITTKKVQVNRVQVQVHRVQVQVPRVCTTMRPPIHTCAYISSALSTHVPG